MSSKNNVDKSEKNYLNNSAEYSGFKEDFFWKTKYKNSKK